MKQYQFSFKSREEFNEKLAEIKKDCETMKHSDVLFYVSWSLETQDTINEIAEDIENVFPEAVYYGNEGSGIISNGAFCDGSNIVCSVFEDEDSRVETVWVQEGTEIATMEELWAYCGTRQGLKAVELIPSIEYLNVLQINDCQVKIDKDILIFGGASVNYKDPTFYATVFAKGHPITKHGMVVMLYFGDNLNFYTNKVLGWKGLGQYMTVTKSEGVTINEINGMPAYSIYEKYLDLSTEDNDSLVFPLILEEEGSEFIKTPQFILPDKSMKMFTPISVGTKVRIAYGDKNTILRSLYEGAEKLAEFNPDIIKMFSCAGRRWFWGDNDISKETVIFQNIAPVSGFYTGGEIIKFGNRLKVLNQTLAIVGIREGAGSVKSQFNFKDKGPDKSLVARLAYFTTTVSEEQEQTKQELIKGQEIIQENMEIIGGLASEYLFLCYMNMDTNTFKIYSMDKERLADTTKLIQKSQNPITLIHMFGNSPAVHPDDRDLFMHFTKESIRERLTGSKKFTVRFRRDYGSGYIWSVMDVVKYEPVDQEANIIAVGFAERDKEIRREQEQQKLLSDALEMAQAANKAKTEFLFNMSHDIRTPMNAILGYTSIGLRHAQDAEKTRDSFTKIKTAGSHLLKLINDILEMSRIESGNFELTNLPLDVYKTVSGVELMSRTLAIPKGIDFKVFVEDLKNPYIYADELHINEIIINLISNAIKYTREGGWVRYTLKQLGPAQDGIMWLRFKVEDNGIGMSEEFQKRLFEAFTRAESSTVSKQEGAGLGLSIVKKIVTIAKGTISVNSKPGEGSTFTVEIPFRVMDDEAIEKFRKENDDEGIIPNDKVLDGLKVLLVEDNEMNREIAGEILSDAGLVIEEAEDGEVAVSAVRNKGIDYYDFILMDIQMPIMNGYEATKIIRAMPGGDTIPIIALSANAFEEDKQKSYAVGMNAHIAKPIDVKELLGMLHKLA